MHKNISTYVADVCFISLLHICFSLCHAEHGASGHQVGEGDQRGIGGGAETRVLQKIGFTKMNNSNKMSLGYFEVLAACHTFGHQRQLLI